MIGRDLGRRSIHRRIFGIALPSCLANLTSVLPGLADSAFIGRTGSAVDLGAMAIAVTACCFVLWAFGFLRLTTAGFAAQAFGAGDGREIRAIFWRAALLAIGFGLAVVLFALTAGGWGLALFGAPEETRAIAATYWRLRMVAAPADLVVYVVMGWLLGLQRARLVLLLQIFLNALNIALCALFVLLLGWGVEGAAVATALAFAATAFLGVGLVAAMQRRMRSRIEARHVLDRAALVRLMLVNRDVFLRTILLMAFLAYLVRLGAGLGPSSLAANHVLFGFIGVIAQILDGVTQASESLTGAAVGARDRADLRLVTGATTVWSASMAIALSALLHLGGPFLMPLFTTDAGTLAAAALALPWLAWSPLVSVWCFQLDGIFLGATRSSEMRNGMALASLGALLASLLAIPALGNDGLWLSLYCFYLLRALPLALWYPRIVRSIPQAA